MPFIMAYFLCWICELIIANVHEQRYYVFGQSSLSKTEEDILEPYP